jgi:hypothetical protein
VIEHVITIKVVEDIDSMSLEVLTPESLSTVQVVGVLEMAKKQFIDSKHTQGPSVFQQPDGDTSA